MHRDIKPENILIDEDRQIKIVSVLSVKFFNTATDLIFFVWYRLTLVTRKNLKIQFTTMSSSMAMKPLSKSPQELKAKQFS